MIILRNKNYSRRDILPEREWFTNMQGLDKETLRIEVKASKNKWAQDKSRLSITEKEIVDKLKSDIKKGNLYIDGPNGGDTHWLKDFSNKDSHLMSKFISYSNRLNYRIYRPEIVMNEDTGEYHYTIKVVLESCLGHGRNGAKNYSDVSE